MYVSGYWTTCGTGRDSKGMGSDVRCLCTYPDFGDCSRAMIIEYSKINGTLHCVRTIGIAKALGNSTFCPASPLLAATASDNAHFNGISASYMPIRLCLTPSSVRLDRKED